MKKLPKVVIPRPFPEYTSRRIHTGMKASWVIKEADPSEYL
jgi:hypothetical protein